jgi:hypothetical protein
LNADWNAARNIRARGLIKLGLAAYADGKLIEYKFLNKSEDPARCGWSYTGQMKLELNSLAYMRRKLERLAAE